MINDPTSSCNASLQAAVPSSVSLNEFWPESQNLVALPHDLQRKINTPLCAIHVSFSLLLALISASKSNETKGTGFGTLQQLHTWVLDSCATLWRFFCRWNLGTDKSSPADDIVGLYLQVLEGISRSLTTLRSHFSSSTKTALALADGLCGMIEDLSVLPLSDINQVHFATVLVRLRGAVVSAPKDVDVLSRRQNTSRLIVLDILEPSVTNLCQNMEEFTALQRDLKVRATLLTKIHH